MMQLELTQSEKGKVYTKHYENIGILFSRTVINQNIITCTYKNLFSCNKIQQNTLNTNLEQDGRSFV